MIGETGPDDQDADLYYLNVGNGTVLTKDGTRWIQAYAGYTCSTTTCATEQFTDGNSISWTSSTVTDTVGRVVTESSGSSFSGSAKTSSSAYVRFSYPDSSGTTRTVTVQMATMQFTCTNNPGTVVSDEGGSNGLYSMPTAIILPDGLTYTFQYDQCGMLREVTYPSGGYTRYDYAAQPAEFEAPGITETMGYYINQIAAKHVCPSPTVALGATSAPSYSNAECPVSEETTTYTPTAFNPGLSSMSYTTNQNTQNVVVDPVGNKTVYQFSLADTSFDSGIPPVETSRKYYDASGKLWKTAATQYASTTAAYPNPGDASQPPPALPTIQTTTLDNGMVSQTQWDYDLQYPGSNDSVLTEERVYDYGNGAPGPLLKRTDYTWLHRDNPSVYGWPVRNVGAHICDRKSSETVYDGNGNKLSKATYVYDNSTPATSGAKGLLTSASIWRSTDGATLTTSYVYDSYGNVTSTTDPNGNVTQYSYADNYTDGVNRNSNAFLTKTTYPSTNGVAHVAQNQYYYGSGLVAAACGENFSGTCKAGLSSGADYASYTYDLMNRKISTTTGDGGQATSCFSELGGTGCSASGYPLMVTTTKSITSGVNKVSAVTLDGEGRATRSQLSSDPSCSGGTVNVDTVYDADGRKSTVTNPYCSTNTGAPTSGTTTYSYDGLSRVIQVQNPDGTSTTSTYTGRAVLSADQGNGTHPVQRISQTDALGRLASVCEITSTTQQGASSETPVSCGLDISGTGFLTTYGYHATGSYGPVDSLTSVTQGAITRSFLYNSLGELLSAHNPESGTTTYSYDKDGNLTSKTAPEENQTGSATVTTSYTYDALNRLTGKQYSDGTTPSACFQYDQSLSTHGIGRLTTEWTQSGACSSSLPSSGILTQRTFAAYDLMGRVTSDQQCSIIGNCVSGTPHSLNYSYDLAGDVTQFGNGLTGASSLAFAGTYDAAGRLATVTGSESANSGTMTNLFTSAAYTPSGALSNAKIGPGITFGRTYNNRLLPTNETDTVATTPGTAIIDVSGSEQISAYSTASITFSGAEEQSSNGVYDAGEIIVVINNTTPIQIEYDRNDTSQTLASSLASLLSCANSSDRGAILPANGLVQAVAVGATVYLLSCTSGAVDYPIQAYFDGNNSTTFPQPSFSVSASGSAMTPVMSPVSYGTTTPPPTDTTATSVTISGVESSTGSGSSATWNNGALVFFVFQGSTNNGGPPIKTVGASWGQNSTADSLAAAVAAQFAQCSTAGTLVTATASGSIVTISSCQSGTTYALSGEVAGSNFSPAAFSVTVNDSTAGSSNVISTPGAVYDGGEVKLTVNGTVIAATSYGEGSTPASIVSSLVSAGANNGLVALAANSANTSELIVTSLINDANYSYAMSAEGGLPTPSFTVSPTSGSLESSTNVALYSWSITSSAPDGEVLEMTDSMMRRWGYSYDDFNRLANATSTAGADDGLTLDWTYDRYGNRWSQTASGSGNATAVQPNFTFSGNNNHIDGFSYDASGNLLNDGRNSYTYDAEGRLITLNGNPTYVYDAEGYRVAKLGSGGSVTNSYLLSLGGEQVTELNSSGAWMHSNVFAGGKLLATYEGPVEPSPNNYHFHLTDWLGTKRMQTTAAGNQEEVCYSYPFGDGLNCTGTDATEHHFTARERDTESGLDYFFARYLNSNLGRFMTPD